MVPRSGLVALVVVFAAAAVVADTCCIGQIGDVNDPGGDEPTIGDISVLIDYLFISQNRLLVSCLPEADINQSGGCYPTPEDITIGDISAYIYCLFIFPGTIDQCLPRCPVCP